MPLCRADSPLFRPVTREEAQRLATEHAADAPPTRALVLSLCRSVRELHDRLDENTVARRRLEQELDDYRITATSR